MSNIFEQKQKSALRVPQALPFLIRLLALTGIISWLYLLYYMLFIYQMHGGFVSKQTALTSNILTGLTNLTFSGSGIYILIKAKYTRATLYFALFSTYLSVYSALYFLFFFKSLPQTWSVILGALIAILNTLLVRTQQEFPARLTPENIRVGFRHYPMKVFVPLLSWLLPGYRTWLVFLPIGLIFNCVVSLPIINALIVYCFTLVYLCVHLRVRNSVSKRPLYWLLWALSLQLLWALLLLSASTFGLQSPPLMRAYASVILNLSLLFAFVMSVYFSDVLDAKLILQKTVIFGVVLFLFTFFFGVAEHFVIHQLSHYFHIEGVYVASTFACVMGMFFHPLKEKLTHWMKRFDRRGENEHIHLASENFNAPNN